MCLVPNREQPSGIGFRFFRNITLTSFPSSKHFETGAEKTIDPNGTFRTHNLIPKIHTAPKGPTDLKLTNGTVGIFNQTNGMVFSVDGVHLGICPAHDFDGLYIFSNKISTNFHTMATQIYNGTTTRFFLIPEPITMRTGMCFPGFCPKHFTYSPFLDTFHGL